jgi:MoxR-like ATPase
VTEFSAVKQAQPLRLHKPLAERHKMTGLYRAAPGLKEALDISMLLGVPLLLTGDPGVGKTRAAFWLAARLGSALLRFDVKSNTTGSDLLYYFDEVARFRDSSRGREARPLVHYLRFNALGKAILAAIGGRAPLFTTAGEPLVGAELVRRRELLVEAFGEAGDVLAAAGSSPDGGEAVARLALLTPDDTGFADADPEHRVVLIDELDKAPRDTPNDLLVEVEEMEFTIPELGIRIRGLPDFGAIASEEMEKLSAADRHLFELCRQMELEPSLRPIIIVTSNSEKSLPDPFLRRCAYFDIQFPEDVELKEIIGHTVEGLSGGGRLVEDALSFFRELRKPNVIAKPPATAELLAWLDVLVHRYGLASDASLASAWQQRSEELAPSLSVVAKGTSLKKCAGIMDAWAKRQRG